MSESDRPSSPAASAFAFGSTVGLASFLLQVLLPIAVRPAGDLFQPAEPLVRSVFFAGSVLRLPLTVGAFSLLAFALDGGVGGKRAGRALAILVALLVLLLDAASYGWLGARGKLFHLASTIEPLDLLKGRPAMLAAAGVLGVAAVSSRIEPALARWLDRRYARAGAATADAIALAVLAVIGVGAVAGSRGSLAIGATPPLVATLVRVEATTTPPPASGEEEPEEPTPDDGIAIPPRDLRALVYEALGTERPLPLADPSRPFCRLEAEPSGPASSPKSVVLLVVRGLDAGSITGNAPTMPTLAALAREEVSFTGAIAGADDPTQGLVQILSGVGPLAPTRYHENARAPRLPSLPLTLRRLGVASFFVSAVDLSPGRERTYLRSLAFDEVDEPTLLAELAQPPTTNVDVRTLDGVRARLASTRGRPRLVAATLGSAMTADSESLSAAQKLEQRRSALAALDAELARFVQDFRRDEVPAGTVLVITSDAVDPAVVVRDGGAAASKSEFRVPLVFVNLPEATKARARERASALVGLHDVAQTVLGLEGQGPVGCFQGRDLFSSDSPVPATRKLVSFAGPDQQYAYVFDGRFRWQLDRTHITEPLQVFDLRTDAALAHDLYDAHDPEADLMRELVLATTALGRYLGMNDRFVPGQAEITARPLPPVQTPEPVADAVGSDLGALTASIAAKKRDGAHTIRLTVDFDAQNAPMLAGRPLGEALATLGRSLHGLDLMLDIAMPERPSPRRSVEVCRSLVAALGTAELPEQTILMPNDPVMAMSLGARTEYPVFVHLPGNALDLVDTAYGFGVDGIVFGADLAARSLIERARLEGLRVAVEGSSTLEALADSGEAGRPDYVLAIAPASPAP